MWQSYVLEDPSPRVELWSVQMVLARQELKEYEEDSSQGNSLVDPWSSQPHQAATTTSLCQESFPWTPWVGDERITCTTTSSRHQLGLTLIS